MELTLLVRQKKKKNEIKFKLQIVRYRCIEEKTRISRLSFQHLSAL